ncbi:MAG: hypothetical protein ACFB4I_22870 [Cyanophyceae cyanobacterium]
MLNAAESKLSLDESAWKGFWNTLQNSKAAWSDHQATPTDVEATEPIKNLLTSRTHQAANTLSQASSSTDQATRTAQSFRETNQALESVRQITHKATAEITQTLKEATEQLTPSQKAQGTLNHLAEKASRAVNHVNEVTSQSVATVSEIAEKAKASLDENLLRAKLDDSVTETVQRALTMARQNWLETHPLLAWLIAHPVLALVTILFFCWLFWGLLTAIGRLTEQAWLAILQSPLKLGQWSVGQIPRGVKRLSGGSNRLPVNSHAHEEHDRKRLADILNRLEQLNQEQEQLMKEMQGILSSKVANEAIASKK